MKDHDRLTSLTRVQDEHEGATIVAALADAGIRAVTTGGHTASFLVGIPGYIDVMVSSKDLPNAKKVLQSLKLDDAEVDWSQVDTRRQDP